MLAKILEKLIYDKLFSFLVRYEILFDSQYGFRTGHNTTHATMDFVKSIEMALDRNEHAIAVFCDLSKAFDTINHQILAKKLEHYGIRNKELDLLISYLGNRRQFVQMNGVKSEELPLTTGVPQGSILGPLLFLIYINDIQATSDLLKAVLFADDSNLLLSGTDLTTSKNILNEELAKVSDYFKSNKLKLNASKTKMVCFRKKSSNFNADNYQIFMDGVQLKFEEQASFLGITIDSHLTWEAHGNNVANKIARNSSMITRVKKILPPASLKILYSSFILPHLQYGVAIWGGYPTKSKRE